MTPDHPEAVAYTAAAPELERAAAPAAAPRNFSKEELLLLVETHHDEGVRRSAGAALYTLGALHAVTR